MDFKQKTIDDLIESEHLMLSNAPKRYGAYYTIALDSSVFLSSAIKAIGRYHETFVRFNSQVAKHHLLAVFSTVRLHHIQATMNLRQVLENGSCAAFAIANPDPTHFANITPEGLLDPSQKLTVKRYDWLDKQFPKGTSQIKAMKDMINESTAHANIAYTNLNFLADSGDQLATRFFDIEDEFFVKADLLLASKIAISLVDLYYGVNEDAKAIVWRDDFHSQFDALIKGEHALRCEMLSSDRGKKAQQKFGHLIK
jgi:hypothetical protein